MSIRFGVGFSNGALFGPSGRCDNSVLYSYCSYYPPITSLHSICGYPQCRQRGFLRGFCYEVKYGMGQHIWTLSEQTLINSQKPFWASIWIYNLSLGFTKASILIQYLRIFTIKQFRIACWSVLAFVIAFSTWTFFGSIFECVPVAYFWDKTIPGGHCMNQYAVWFTNASVNIATDFTIIILPMPVLKGLKLPMKQKRALVCIFALGGFVCIVSILRLQSLVAISNSKDPTFDNPPAATWSAIETNVGLICACLASLRPLATRLFPRLFKSTICASEYDARGDPSVREGGIQLSIRKPEINEIKVVTVVSQSVDTVEHDAEAANSPPISPVRQETPVSPSSSSTLSSVRQEMMPVSPGSSGSRRPSQEMDAGDAVLERKGV